MLTIVNAKPAQVAAVSAVALWVAAALCATSAENSGESAITTVPQNSKYPMYKIGGSQ